MGVGFLFSSVCFFFYLQCVWLSKENLCTERHCQPNICHLCSNVAEGQVADHPFLLLLIVRVHDEPSRHGRRPRQLEREPQQR